MSTTGEECRALVVSAFLAVFVLDALTEWLNARWAAGAAPSALRDRASREFAGLIDEAKLKQSASYLKEGARLGIVRQGLATAVLVATLVTGLLGRLDDWARGLGWGEIRTGLLFAGVVLGVQMLLDLPFSWYSTFNIEERYGFNRTTKRTFVIDRLKGLLLGALLGGAALAAIIKFFEKLGPGGWLWAWIALTALQLLLLFLAPAVLMPLFNKFEPIPAGALKDSIDRLVEGYRFKVGGIYTMDGSKRSTKANAFFTGFGKLRKLVLFDTLIKKHTEEELLGVLAHEIGHFRLGHIPRTLALSVATTGVLFFALSHLIFSPALAHAFGLDQPSVHAGVILAVIAWSPLSRVFSVAGMALSRKHEFEADDFAARTYGKPEALAEALKKLSVENLSNLTPHPLKVLLDYSHPPVIERVAALRKRAVPAE